MTCTAPDCPQPSRTRGLCQRHYKAARRGDASLVMAPPIRGNGIVHRPKPCGGPSCDRPATTRGLCKAHDRQRRNGRPLSILGTTAHRNGGRADGMPPGWDRPSVPSKLGRTAPTGEPNVTLGPVQPTPPGILADALVVLRRHGAGDLAAMLGLVDA